MGIPVYWSLIPFNPPSKTLKPTLKQTRPTRSSIRRPLSRSRPLYSEILRREARGETSIGSFIPQRQRSETTIRDSSIDHTERDHVPWDNHTNGLTAVENLEELRYQTSLSFGRDEDGEDRREEDDPNPSLEWFESRGFSIGSLLRDDVRISSRGVDGVGTRESDPPSRLYQQQQPSRPPFPVPSSSTTQQHGNSELNSLRVDFDGVFEDSVPFSAYSEWMGDDTPSSSTTDPIQSPELSIGYLLDGEGGRGEYESDESDTPRYSPPSRVEGMQEYYADEDRVRWRF